MLRPAKMLAAFEEGGGEEEEEEEINFEKNTTTRTITIPAFRPGSIAFLIAFQPSNIHCEHIARFLQQ